MTGCRSQVTDRRSQVTHYEDILHQNYISSLVSLRTRYRWFSVTWWDGHVGAQNNSKLWLVFCIIIESNSQKTFSLLFCAPTWPRWRQVKTTYRRILVDIFCLISTGLWLSDLATNWNFWMLKSISISVVSENLSPISKNSFGAILFETPQNLQNNLTFCHPLILQFLLAAIFFVIFCYCMIAKSWMLHKLRKLTSSFNFWT